MSQRLGDLLVKEKIITHDQLDKALKAQREQGPNSRLGSTLVHLGFVSEEEVKNFLPRQYGVPAINLQYFEIDSSVVKLIPEETAQKYQILPLSRVGSTLTIAMIDPTNVFAMDDIKFMTGFNIEPVVASETAIREAIDKYYGSTHAIELKKVMEDIAIIDQKLEGDDTSLELASEEEAIDLEGLEQAAEEAPIIKLVKLNLSSALNRGASDIHIEPYEKEFRVRYRIDGMLYNIMNPPLKLKDAITSR